MTKLTDVTASLLLIMSGQFINNKKTKNKKKQTFFSFMVLSFICCLHSKVSQAVRHNLFFKN